MDETEIHCPNCMALLPKELQRELYSGKSITCENCGILLVPRVHGQGSKPNGMASQGSKVPTIPGTNEISSNAPSQPSTKAPPASVTQRWLEDKERQRQQRREILEARIQQRRESREQRHQQRDEVKEQRHQQRDEIKEQRKTARKTTIEAPSSPVRSKKSISRETRLHEYLDRSKRRIHIFNDASFNLMKLFLGLFYIVSIAGLVYNFVLFGFNVVLLISTLLKLTPLYVIGAFMYWYETRKLRPWLLHDQYEFYGIDIVIIGIIGLAVYGIGIFLLIKGFMVMDYMIKQDRLSSRPRREIIILWINGFDEISWMIAALGAAFAINAMAYSIINSVVLYVPDPSFISFLVLGILGIIAANNDLQKVSSRIRAWEFNGLGGKTLVNGILGCVCLGTGVPLLVKAILLFQIDELDHRAPVSQSKVEHPVDVQIPRQDEAQPISRQELRGPVLKSQQPGQPLEITPAPLHKAPVPVQERAPARQAAPAKAKIKPAISPATLPRKSPVSIEAFLQRSFSVLTPRVRKRLLKLKKIGMSDADIEGVTEELVFHPEFEQLDIIADYMDLNKDVDPMHVLAVRKMNYDENTKKWILDQLKMIPEKDIPAFLDQMKNSQPN